MQGYFTKFFNSFVEWLFRPRSVGLALIRGGITLFGLIFAFGFIFNLSWPISNGHIDLKIDTSNGTPQLIAYLIAALASGLILLGGWLEFRRFQRLQRKRVIAIEMRGLRDSHGDPLVEAIPPRFEGNREQLLIDVRQLDDGKISSPSHALARILQLPNDLKGRIDGVDRDEVTVIYGGLAPVPYTFLVGVLLDDEARLEVMDWDRTQQSWRTLDEPDDGARFEISGMDGIAKGQDTVVLAVSGSYDIDLAGVRERFPTLPIVALDLTQRSTSSHWSDAKQSALCSQFLDTLIALSARGVQTIQLFLAAPSSMVLNLGRSYDKRNLPAVIVHQYERSETPPFPWGLLMPVSGASAAIVNAN